MRSIFIAYDRIFRNRLVAPARPVLSQFKSLKISRSATFLWSESADRRILKLWNCTGQVQQSFCCNTIYACFFINASFICDWSTWPMQLNGFTSIISAKWLSVVATWRWLKVLLFHMPNETCNMWQRLGIVLLCCGEGMNNIVPKGLKDGGEKKKKETIYSERELKSFYFSQEAKKKKMDRLNKEVESKEKNK